MELLRAATIATAQALYLFSPLLVSAAISGVVLRYEWLAFLRRPIDLGATFRGRRVFGDSKTWRGIVVALLGCIASVCLQRALADAIPAALQIVSYASVSPVWLGAAMALGAMGGELPNSFVKRQVGIPPGKSTQGWPAAAFYVWDQVDLLLGARPLLCIWIRPHLAVIVASFVLAMVVHPLVALIGFLIGARSSAR